MEGPHKEVQEGFPSESPFMSPLLWSGFPLLLVEVNKRPQPERQLSHFSCHVMKGLVEGLRQGSLQRSPTKANFKHNFCPTAHSSKHPNTYTSSLYFYPLLLAQQAVCWSFRMELLSASLICQHVLLIHFLLLIKQHA